MTSPGTFWRTVRHLRSEQVVGRLKFRLARPVPDLRPAPFLRPSVGEWVAPAARKQSLIAPGRLRFLNEAHALADIGWDDLAIEKLWRYNLHYFDDLNAEGAAQRTADQREIVACWIVQNSPGKGTGWEPYPTSLRVVNWIKWFASGATADGEWLHSLAVQVRWLRERLEWHLLGNHLFANAKALAYAGLFFDGPEADAWLAQGLAILERELPEQILADGGQFERSPMYHALALEDVLDLLCIIGARAGSDSPARRLEPALLTHAPRMLHWLRAMTHPNGAVGQFNDSADGIAPSNAELERLAAALNIRAPAPALEGVTQLDASGYLRVARDRAVALLDVAPVGPDYLPGHAHADTLSFELSLGGRRVVVNRGTSCYGSSARRLLERGTAAHSTVQVADENSSEVWSGFRVGRRARPLNLHIDVWSVACSHDGYRHLPGSPQHRRKWRFGEHALSIEDVVTGRVRSVARYHLAPGLQLQREADHTWLVNAEGATVAKVRVETGSARATDWLHAAHFGVLEPAQTLEVTLEDGSALTHWSW